METTVTVTSKILESKNASVVEDWEQGLEIRPFLNAKNINFKHCIPSTHIASVMFS